MKIPNIDFKEDEEPLQSNVQGADSKGDDDPMQTDIDSKGDDKSLQFNIEGIDCNDIA